MGNEQGKDQGVPTPAGIHSMDESLQKKFSKGIQYNMKIVIRGDRNTGKTTLFHRMEGKAFTDAYTPTNEIQVTSILWSYQVTNDTVKVEIWDVVDKGKSQRRYSGGKGLLKMFNNSEDNDGDEGDESGQTLDATFLDVYKGAHGVVFCFDITKQWTWKYIERQLPEVPLHIPVIILANFCDMNEHRLISRENCVAVIESFERPDGAADVRYAECSMKNGFGLTHLHKFLNIPFLQLQQETLLQQLQVNREQGLAAMEELDEAINTDDQNYNMYLAKLQKIAESKKRKVVRQDSTGNEIPVSSLRRDTLEGSNTPPQSRQTPSVDRPLPPTEPRAQPQPQPQRSGSIATKLSSRLSGFLGKGKENAKIEDPKSNVPPSRPKVATETNIEEFVPEGGVDDFLDDEEEEEEEEEEEDDSDSDEGNPMIAGDEDLSTPETTPLPLPKTLKKKFKLDDSDSSEEEEEEEEEDSSIVIPIKAHQPKSNPKPLKSALDVELTDSEEEEGPVVMGDSDIDGEEKHSTTTSSSSKNQSLKAKKTNTGLDIFEPLPPPPPPTTVTNKKKKSTGLMLQFEPSPKVSPVASPKKKTVSLDPEESPDNGKKEKKKKKSKKKKSSSKEEDGVAVSNSIKGQGSNNNGAVSTSSTTDDPFGAIASLDAWLNSDSGDASNLLTPTAIPSKKGAREELGKEEVDGEEEEEEERPKKSKKHKHKSRSDGGGGGGGEDTGGSSRKKKHKSHHKSSRHKELDQGGDYQNI